MKNLNYKTLRRLVFALLMLLTLSLNAQDGVIRFKGIPVDGTKNEMISNLKQKGFTYDYAKDMFRGIFDGEKIVGFIQTYNDKVYNIRFAYDVDGYQKTVVIHRFNSLVGRFDTNEKYLSYINFDKIMNDIDTYEIDTYEDIGYEMKRGKIYKAQYLYKYDKDLTDTTGFYQFKNEAYRLVNSASVSQGVNLDTIIDDYTIEVLFIMQKLEQDLVQFYIIEGFDYNTFNIMFDYYNRRNAPNGEDL